MLVEGSCWDVMQAAAAEAAAKAEAQEVRAWKRDATAVLAALDTTHAEKITEVILICMVIVIDHMQILMCKAHVT